MLDHLPSQVKIILPRIYAGIILISMKRLLQQLEPLILHTVLLFKKKNQNATESTVIQHPLIGRSKARSITFQPKELCDACFLKEICERVLDVFKISIDVHVASEIALMSDLFMGLMQKKSGRKQTNSTWMDWLGFYTTSTGDQPEVQSIVYCMPLQ